MLSQKDYGFQSSAKYMWDDQSENNNIGYDFFYGQIGSDDSIIPKGFGLSYKNQLGGASMKSTKVLKDIKL